MDSSQAALPIHRWLRFGDSWDERMVHRAFDMIGVRRKEVIYDPFAGCGTTPLAAAARGLRTVSMDRSALAVLATAVKLYPPDLAMLAEVEETLRSCPCNILIRKLQVRRLRRGSASPAQRALVFALMAGWYRARHLAHQASRGGAGFPGTGLQGAGLQGAGLQHAVSPGTGPQRSDLDAADAQERRAGAALMAGAGAAIARTAPAAAAAASAPGAGAGLAAAIEARWLDEALRVVEEMREDQPDPQARPIQHVVRCRDFITEVTRLPGLTGRNSIVMVTSPPLPLRHVDTDHQRLDRMIHTTVPRLRIFDRHDHRTEPLGTIEMRRVSAYERFLDDLLAHAQYLQCTALAVEISARPAPQGKPCDQLLISRLPAFGFTLLDTYRSVRDASGTPGTITARPREPLTLICAVAAGSHGHGAGSDPESDNGSDPDSDEHGEMPPPFNDGRRGTFESASYSSPFFNASIRKSLDRTASAMIVSVGF